MTPINLDLRAMREARGLTQGQLARRSKVPQSTISRLESGRTGSISFANLERLADALGCNAVKLIHHTRRH